MVFWCTVVTEQAHYFPFAPNHAVKLLCQFKAACWALSLQLIKRSYHVDTRCDNVEHVASGIGQKLFPNYVVVGLKIEHAVLAAINEVELNGRGCCIICGIIENVACTSIGYGENVETIVEGVLRVLSHAIECKVVNLKLYAVVTDATGHDSYFFARSEVNARGVFVGVVVGIGQEFCLQVNDRTIGFVTAHTEGCAIGAVKDILSQLFGQGIGHGINVGLRYFRL